MQERARNEAELDATWADDEHDDLGRNISSRASTPDHDFIDIEGGDRPLSSNSTSSQQQHKQLGPPLILPMPEVKRSRGRPRKFPEHSEEGGTPKVSTGVKRGRGRPRKNSFNSNLSNTQNSYLDEGKWTPIFMISNTIVYLNQWFANFFVHGTQKKNICVAAQIEIFNYF